MQTSCRVAGIATFIFFRGVRVETHEVCGWEEGWLTFRGGHPDRKFQHLESEALPGHRCTSTSPQNNNHNKAAAVTSPWIHHTMHQKGDHCENRRTSDVSINHVTEVCFGSERQREEWCDGQTSSSKSNKFLTARNYSCSVYLLRGQQITPKKIIHKMFFS